MKKFLLFSGIALALTLSISSCKSCKVCTKPSSTEVRVCEKDYANTTIYGLTVDSYVALGYSCKSAI